MARGRQTITQRIALEGGEEIRKELEQFGKIGELAFKKLAAAAKSLKPPDDKFVAGLKRMQKELQATAKQLETTGRKIRDFGKDLSFATTLPLAGAGAGILKVAGDFEDIMNTIRLQGDASVPQLVKLKELILEISAASRFSAQQIAEGSLEMARLGVDAQTQMEGALASAVRIAGATGGTVDEAAKILAASAKAFDIPAREMPRAANLISGAVNQSKLNLTEFAQSFAQAAASASQGGVSFEDFNVMIAATSDFLGQASDSGTSFKTFMLQIANPTKEARKAFQELGVDLFDIQGNFVGATSAALQLNKAFSGLSDEETLSKAAVAAGQDASRFLLALSKVGKGLDDVRAKVNKTDAALIESERMKTFRGAWDQLGGSIQEASIRIGDSGFLKVATDLVLKMKEIPDAVAKASPEILGLGVVFGTVLGSIGPTITAIGQLALGLGALAIAAKVTLGAMVTFFGAIAIGVIGGATLGAIILALARNLLSSEDAAKLHAESMERLDESIKKVTENAPGAVEAFKKTAEASIKAANDAVIAAEANLEQARSEHERIKAMDIFYDVFNIRERLVREKVTAMEIALAEADARLLDTIEKVKRAAESGFDPLGKSAAEAASGSDDLADSLNKVSDAADRIAILGGGEVISGKEAREQSDHVISVTEAMEKLAEIHKGVAQRTQITKAAMEAAAETSKKLKKEIDEINGVSAAPESGLTEQLVASNEAATQFSTTLQEIKGDLTFFEGSIQAAIINLGNNLKRLGDREAFAPDSAEAQQAFKALTDAGQIAITTLENRIADLRTAVAEGQVPEQFRAEFEKVLTDASAFSQRMRSEIENGLNQTDAGAFSKSVIEGFRILFTEAKAVSDNIQAEINKIPQAAQNIQIAEAVTQEAKAAAPGMQAAIDEVLTNLDRLPKGAITTGLATKEGIIGPLREIPTEFIILQESVTSTFNGLITEAQAAGQNLAPAFAAVPSLLLPIWERIRTDANAVWLGVPIDAQAALAPTEASFQAFADRARAGWASFAQASQLAWQQSAQSAANFENKTTPEFTQAKNAIVAVLNGLGALLSPIWAGLPAGAQTAASGLVSAFAGVPGQIAGSFAGLAGSITSQFDAIAAGVEAMISRLNAALASLEAQIASAKAELANAQSGSGGGGFARGGAVYGPGSGTSDSIPAWLSSGEFVIRAAAVRKYGKAIFAALNSMRLPHASIPALSLDGITDALTTRMSSRGYAPRLATGGMIEAAAPQNMKGLSGFTLAIEDRMFPVFAPHDTVGQISEAALRRRLRSAGKKPLWYGS